jgi:glutamate dehydrogenase/leucine dehydrogenase
VLLQAASEADLRRTHRRYFESFAELIEPKQQVQAPNVAEGTADYRTSKDQ